MADAKPVLKILCLHGYRQNAETFRGRTGAFRKIIKNHAELVFITAPNVVPPLPDAETSDPDSRGWWFSRSDDYFMAQDETTCCKGYDESLQVITQALIEQGPFDGVLAFSQGASMLSLLCAIQQAQGPDCPFHFEFAVVIAGFRSRTESHRSLYNDQIMIPTLHVYGETDKVIEKEMSEDLLSCFHEPEVLVHPGGHFIPASGPQKKVYLEFFNKMLSRKLEARNS